MGITLKCGDTKIYNTYRLWNNFRIIMAIACVEYLKCSIKRDMQTKILTENKLCLYNDINSEDNKELLFYFNLFIKHIEYLKDLNLIGIYHLLSIPDNKGYYIYNNSSEILKTIDMVGEYIDTQKINIQPYRELFDNSCQSKKNIYIL